MQKQKQKKQQKQNAQYSLRLWIIFVFNCNETM